MKFGLLPIAFLVVCLLCAALASTLIYVLLTKPAPEPAGAAGTAETAATGTVMSAGDQIAQSFYDTRSQLVDELMNALKEEKKVVEDKISQMEEWDARLQLQTNIFAHGEARFADLKTEITNLMQTVELSVNKIDAHEEENIARLAEVCSKMEPQSAVEMLRNMNKDRAAKIINLITERQAAKIMDAAVASQEDGAKLASDWADLIRKMNGQASAGGGAP